MKTVVILGGGFGGVRCALDLSRRGQGIVRVILVDRNSYHLFTPSLYEVASAYPVPHDSAFHVPLRRTIAIPYREIFQGTSVEVLEAEIASVNLAQKEIIMDDGEKLDFDYCVLALGSQGSDFGIAGVNEYAYPFKTMSDGIAVNQKMHELFRGLQTGLVKAPIKFLVIGAGFTGIELAAELASYASRIAKHLGIDKKYFSVILFEAAPTILPMISNSERLIIMKRLTSLGVMIMENSAIESVKADSVSLKSGQVVPGSMVVWTAGVKANELIQSIHVLPVSPKGKVLVDEKLNAHGLLNIFAVGDAIEFIDPKTEKPIPGLAYTAKAQGSIVAQNILADIAGKPKRSYYPNYEAWIAPVGAKFSLAHLGPSRYVQGLIGWAVRGIVDLRYFLSVLPMSKAFKLIRKDLWMFTRND